mgnify:CR=1 FL=1
MFQSKNFTIVNIRFFYEGQWCAQSFQVSSYENTAGLGILQNDLDYVYLWNISIESDILLQLKAKQWN